MMKTASSTILVTAPMPVTPKSRSSGSVKRSRKADRSSSKAQTSTKALPKARFIRLVSPWPEKRLKQVEPPALHMSPKAIIM